MPSIQEMLQQARMVQEEMQRQLEDLRVEASAGGGIVTVRMNGQKFLLELKIDPEAVKDGDVEMLQDLVMAAINQASRQVDEQFQKKLGSLAGGLGIPGLV
jgi:DNA-binding YbaB/EbfC family protein